MADIFISYSSQDKERITHLAKMLSKIGGWSVWLDREIQLGKSFDEVIWEELTNARCVLVVWSSQSIKSDWVIEEAQEGRKRKLLIPVLIDNVSIPFGFRRLQAANLIAWNGSEEDTQFKKLINDIVSILGHRQEPFHSTVEQPTSTSKPSNQQKTLGTTPLTLGEKSKATLLIALSLVVGVVVGVPTDLAFGKGIGEAIGGLLTGACLHLAGPSFRWRKITLLVISGGGVVGGIVIMVIGRVVGGDVAYFIGQVSAGAIFGAIGGGIAIWNFNNVRPKP